MAFTIGNTQYNGEVIQQLFTELTTGNELFEAGIFRIVEGGYESTIAIPTVESTVALQPRAEEPVTSGSTQYKEKVITMADVMIYQEFNPKTFENIWRPYQSTGPLVFEELDPEVQSALLSTILAKKGVKVSEIAFQGDTALTGATSSNIHLTLADGVIKLALADSAVKDVANPAPLTAANIVSALTQTYKTSVVEARSQDNYKFLMSVADWDKYVDAQQSEQFKGAFFTADGTPRYRGKDIIVLNSVPENVIIATPVSTSDDSNLYMGAGLVIDHDTLRVERKANGSEKWFVKMLFKLGFQIKFGKDVTLYDGRA